MSEKPGNAHAQAFYNWLGLRPKGTDEKKAMRAYYDEMSKLMHSHNEAATRYGIRADWAWRQMKEDAR